jgi:hypothetical protein
MKTGFYSVADIIRCEQNPDILSHPVDYLVLLLRVNRHSDKNILFSNDCLTVSDVLNFRKISASVSMGCFFYYSLSLGLGRWHHTVDMGIIRNPFMLVDPLTNAVNTPSLEISQI